MQTLSGLYIGVFVAGLLVAPGAQGKTLGTEKAKQHTFQIDELYRANDTIWSFFFLDSQKVFLALKSGEIQTVSLQTGAVKKIKNGFAVEQVGQGGLLDVEPHPDFSKNRWLYFTFAQRGTKTAGFTTFLARAKLQDDRLTDRQVLLEAIAHAPGGRHFGSRIAFDAKGDLYITVGDRGERQRAQSLKSHAGKVLRLKDDGMPHPQNPFAKKGGLAEIYSFGHRNPQGLAFDPKGRLWLTEHGPRGGDEINLVKRGANYGWPKVTYGREYSGGKIAGGKTSDPAFAEPVKYYVPSIAPCGLVWYDGKAFPNWRGSLFSGALAMTHLNRVAIEGGKAVAEERLLEAQGFRVRSVEQGPDGLLYLSTDGGQLIRLSPGKK